MHYFTLRWLSALSRSSFLSQSTATIALNFVQESVATHFYALNVIASFLGSIETLFDLKNRINLCPYLRH